MDSCPTWGGRTQIDESVGQEVERRLSHVTKPFDVAVWAAANGPGEAAQADMGHSRWQGEGLTFPARGSNKKA